MTIVSKISGWSIKDFDIKRVFENQIITLNETIARIKNQKAMDYILDTFRFTKSGTDNGEWYAILDYDSIYKVSILENYPEYEKELADRFGEEWWKFYLRFNH